MSNFALLSVCRDSIRAFDGGIACGVYSRDGEALAYHESEQKHPDCDATIKTALFLLGSAGEAETSLVSGVGIAPETPREVFLGGIVHGFARLLVSRGVVVVLVSSTSNSVGIGWAALSVLSSKVESAL